ncbi:MAG: MarR family transcriptional regulator [Cytophagales bacterium]|nr:MarR family transcriptional regulator [Cytophagales bacterium]
MSIGDDIQQKKFASEFSKALVNIRYTECWLGQRYHGLLKPSGLTIPQYNVLRILRGQFPSPATVNLLIERMIDKSSNASRIVDKLEEKGLVDRCQCTNDRRAVDVKISQLGLELLKTLDNELAILEKGMKSLSEEEAEHLNHLLDKIRS